MIDLESITKLEELPTQIAYLSALGILDESEEAIEAAKQVYRRVYKRLHARAQRQTKREYRVRFGVDDVEAIATEASKHGLSMSGFIQKAALAYMKQDYLEPDPLQVGILELFLSRAYSSIQRIEERSKSDSREFKLFEKLYEIIEAMEREVVSRLRSPARLMEIIQDHLKRQPAFRARLEAMLTEAKNYGD